MVICSKLLPNPTEYFVECRCAHNGCCYITGQLMSKGFRSISISSKIVLLFLCRRSVGARNNLTKGYSLIIRSDSSFTHHINSITLQYIDFSATVWPLTQYYTHWHHNPAEALPLDQVPGSGSHDPLLGGIAMTIAFDTLLMRCLVPGCSMLESVIPITD